VIVDAFLTLSGTIYGWVSGINPYFLFLAGVFAFFLMGLGFNYFSKSKHERDSEPRTKPGRPVTPLEFFHDFLDLKIFQAHYFFENYKKFKPVHVARLLREIASGIGTALGREEKDFIEKLHSESSWRIADMMSGSDGVSIKDEMEKLSRSLQVLKQRASSADALAQHYQPRDLKLLEGSPLPPDREGVWYGLNGIDLYRFDSGKKEYQGSPDRMKEEMGYEDSTDPGVVPVNKTLFDQYRRI